MIVLLNIGGYYMLTKQEELNTAHELQENFSRLNSDLPTILNDLQISEEELNQILNMDNPEPGHVWMVRDYLEDKLKEQGTEVYPFSRLADHSANRWFNTPWRN